MRRRTTWILMVVLLALGAGIGVWLAQRTARTTPATLPTTSARHDETKLTSPSLVAAPTRAGIVAAIDSNHEPRTVVRLVRSGTTTPVGGAALTIVSLSGGSNQVTTDATGTVALPTASLAESRIEVRAPDYCTATFSLSAEVPPELTYELFPSGKFAVHVRDTAGAPLEYRIVTVEMDQLAVPRKVQASLRPTWPVWGSRERRSQTDAHGDVIVEDMPHGLKLIVECQNSRVETALDPLLAVTPVEIVVATDLCILGRLVREDGSPAFPLDNDWPAAVETVERGGGTSLTRAFLQKDGSFRLGPLPRGRTLWKVVYPSQSVRCTNLIDGPVDVGNIVLSRAFMCSGRFVHGSHPEWTEARNVRYYARRDGVVTAQQHSTDEDGTFRIRILEGPATLDVSVGERTVRSIDVVSPFQGLIVDLDQMVGAIRVLTAGGRVDTSLNVVLIPVENASAPRLEYPHGTLRPGSAGGKQGVRECEGGFRVINVPPGTFDVFLTSSENPSIVRRLGRAVVKPGEESVVDGSKIVPAELGVTVKDVEGRPVADFDVQARFGTTLLAYNTELFAKTNAAGEAAFSNLSSGIWTVSSKARGSSAPEAQSVDLQEGEKRAVSIVVGKSGRIRGSVTRHGEPAPEVRITLSLPKAPLVRTPVQVVSDERGQFQFDLVIEGRYRLLFSQGTANTPTHRISTRVIDVVPGAETLCNVDLDAQLRPVIVRIDGKEFDELDGGIAWTPDGYNTFQRRPELENRWCVNVRSGPALLSFHSKAFSRFDFDARQSSMCYALVPQLDPSDGPIVVDLRGATIVVHLSDRKATFPVARLIAVPVIGDVKHLGNLFGLAPEDAGDERTFRFVGVGSTIILCAGEGAPLDTRELTLTVTNESTIRVEWPPR